MRNAPRVHRRPKPPGRSVRQIARKNTNAKSNVNRDEEVRRLYDKRWAETSREFRKEYPACVLHFKKGMVVLPEVVDHWIPHKGDSQLFWDPENWVPLCKSCHDGPKRRIELAWSNGAPITQRPKLITIDMIAEFVIHGRGN